MEDLEGGAGAVGVGEVNVLEGVLGVRFKEVVLALEGNSFEAFWREPVNEIVETDVGGEVLVTGVLIGGGRVDDLVE